MSLDYKMEAQDDIVKQVLKNNEKLKTDYYEALDCYTKGHVEIAELSTKLHSLSDSVASAISDNSLELQTLINVLDTIESYTVLLEDDESKDIIEVMFFEGILNTLSHITENDSNYRYVRLFKDNLGPASEELCEKNNAFWKELMSRKPESSF